MGGVGSGPHELNDEVAEFCIQKGEPGRNVFGYNGDPTVRWRYRHFKNEIDSQMAEPCIYHHHDPPLTKMQCLAAGLIKLALVDHERWATQTLLNRWLGRVPLQVDGGIDLRGELQLTKVVREIIDVHPVPEETTELCPVPEAPDDAVDGHPIPELETPNGG